jgi:hypothetical protein
MGRKLAGFAIFTIILKAFIQRVLLLKIGKKIVKCVLPPVPGIQE